jgi:hypothetical protein
MEVQRVHEAQGVDAAQVGDTEEGEQLLNLGEQLGLAGERYRSPFNNRAKASTFRIASLTGL